jgi:hypothetical protein
MLDLHRTVTVAVPCMLGGHRTRVVAVRCCVVYHMLCFCKPVFGVKMLSWAQFYSSWGWVEWGGVLVLGLLILGVVGV